MVKMRLHAVNRHILEFCDYSAGFGVVAFIVGVAHGERFSREDAFLFYAFEKGVLCDAVVEESNGTWTGG